MSNPLLKNLDLDHLTPARLWHELDGDTRKHAAVALLSEGMGDRELRQQAEASLAQALHFRVATVRKMAIEKKAAYLTKMIRPDDSLASSLLLSLHLGERRPVLTAFLDALGIEHDNGLITGDDDFEPPTTEALGKAAEGLDSSFESSQVDVYLASLYAMDDETWAGLLPILQARRDA